MAVSAASAGGCSAARRHDYDYRNDDSIRLPRFKKTPKQGKSTNTKTPKPTSVSSSPKKDDGTQPPSAKCNVL
ncbi:hypothetical protein KP79_PYT13852 [Mizuhopecten yessoensis]|uniref:Uncharacterized protein n=1 Tax=Mizuhopecten yessoensis TaxID=6573 RepID=A0A210PGM5_MIZYE|nr:hypothetical protein KP79_PYT13852 [Mizuhopecten yessoensis]